MKNTFNLKPGDKVTFVQPNVVKDYQRTIEISRISESSYWDGRGFRESWGTMQKYSKYQNFTIIRES